MRCSLLRAVAGGATVIALAAPAYAAWDTTGTGTGTAATDQLPTAAAPTAADPVGRDVQVGWTSTTFRGATLESRTGGGYALSRDGVGVSGCSLAVTSCLDTGVPPGPRTYRVTNLLGAWSNASGATKTVTVPAPSLSLSPSTWSAPGTTFTGSLRGFLDQAPLAYRLDDPVSGALLPGDSTPFPTNPTTVPTRTMSVSCGPADRTTHTIYVANDTTTPAAGTFTANFASVLCPAQLTGAAGSVSGRAQAGDTVSITWSSLVNGTSICATLTGPGTTTAPFDNVEVRVVDGGGSASDRLEIAIPVPSTLLGLGAPGACGSIAPTLVLGGRAGSVTLGTLELGSAGYVSGAPLVFAGSALAGTNSVLSLSGNTLVIKLGSLVSGTPLTATVTGPATYTPPSASPFITGLPTGNATGSQTSGAPLL